MYLRSFCEKSWCHTWLQLKHELNTCKSAYTLIQLRQISSIRHFFTHQGTRTLVCALILSRLDYCNCLLAGCPLYHIDRMQKVQNAAARLIPSVWNTVPLDIRTSESQSCFKSKLKTHLFELAYWLDAHVRTCVCLCVCVCVVCVCCVRVRVSVCVCI